MAARSVIGGARRRRRPSWALSIVKVAPRPVPGLRGGEPAAVLLDDRAADGQAQS